MRRIAADRTGSGRSNAPRASLVRRGARRPRQGRRRRLRRQRRVRGSSAAVLGPKNCGRAPLQQPRRQRRGARRRRRAALRRGAAEVTASATARWVRVTRGVIAAMRRATAATAALRRSLRGRAPSAAAAGAGGGASASGAMASSAIGPNAREERAAGRTRGARARGRAHGALPTRETAVRSADEVSARVSREGPACRPPVPPRTSARAPQPLHVAARTGAQASFIKALRLRLLRKRSRRLPCHLAPLRAAAEPRASRSRARRALNPRVPCAQPRAACSPHGASLCPPP